MLRHGNVNLMKNTMRGSSYKIDLLVMGSDNDKIHYDKMPELRNLLRQKHHNEKDDFVIITGGKITEKFLKIIIKEL